LCELRGLIPRTEGKECKRDMSEDTFTEVTSQSWFGRIGESLKGVLAGVVLVIISIALLFWNEGRAVKRARSLKEGRSVVISASVDVVKPANAGKLLHVTGKAVTDEVLGDRTFGISANALLLKRDVEMYQWEEKKKSHTRKRIGGGTRTVTTYTYNKVWSEELIDSSRFRKPGEHRNPSSMRCQEKRWAAQRARLGAFHLPSSILERIYDLDPLPAESVPANLRGRAVLHDEGFYVGKDPGDPQIGDLRVSFSVLRPTEISLVAKQIERTFEPYGTKGGGSVLLVERGVHSADEMFRKAEQAARILTWVLRAVGYVLMVGGLALIFRPLSVVADVLPLLGDIVGLGTMLAALVLGTALSIVTIAVAWLFFRPLVGCILIAAVIAGIVTIKRLRAKKTRMAKAAAGPTP
jgi:hypothetical protein